MKTFLAAADVTLVIPLRVNGEPFVPDTASVSYTLRDAAGSVLAADVAVSMVALSTEATITILAVNNALGAGRFSKRSVLLKCTKSTRPVVFKELYRLVPWLNTTVTPQDVRSFIGVDAQELPDEAIDIESAYFDVEDEITQAILTTALSAADESERRANDAILAKAVLNLMPGLPLRLSQNATDGVFSLTRPKIDFAALEARAALLYASAVDVVGVRLEVTPDLIITAVLSPDPLTGA